MPRKKYFLVNTENNFSKASPIDSKEVPTKQTPSTTLLEEEEEEDKILEENESSLQVSPPITISITYSFQKQFFQEPSLIVNDLPPWLI